jgi:hypothetical protein
VVVRKKAKLQGKGSQGKSNGWGQGRGDDLRGDGPKWARTVGGWVGKGDATQGGVEVKVGLKGALQGGDE